MNNKNNSYSNVNIPRVYRKSISSLYKQIQINEGIFDWLRTKLSSESKIITLISKGELNKALELTQRYRIGFNSPIRYGIKIFGRYYYNLPMIFCAIGKFIEKHDITQISNICDYIILLLRTFIPDKIDQCLQIKPNELTTYTDLLSFAITHSGKFPYQNLTKFDDRAIIHMLKKLNLEKSIIDSLSGFKLFIQENDATLTQEYIKKLSATRKNNNNDTDLLVPIGNKLRFKPHKLFLHEPDIKKVSGEIFGTLQKKI